MSKNVIVLYILPTIFIGMFLVYWKENLLTWIMFLVCLIIPVIIAYLYVKSGGNIKVILVGNAMFFLTNIVAILYLNKIKLAKETGQLWHGYFKPLYTEDLFVLLFSIVFVVELVIYSAVKNK